jgi:hypothetical protein
MINKLKFAALSGLLLSTGIASSSAAVSINFATPNAYATNFTSLNTGGFFTAQSTHVRGRQDGAFWGFTQYSPGYKGYEVSASSSLEGALGVTANMSLMLGYNTSTQQAVVARVLIASTTNIRLQISVGVDVTSNSGSGTLLLDWEYNVYSGGAGLYRTALNSAGASGATGQALSVSAPYTMKFEQDMDLNAFKFSVYTSTGTLLATSGFQTHLSLADIAMGGVGFGGVAGNAQGQSLHFYDFQTIPEPGAVSLIIGGALLGAAFLRNNRNRLASKR